MKVIEFIQEYWPYLSTIIVVVVDLIIFIFKKTKVKFNDEGFFGDLIRFVEEAELKFGPGTGEEKLNYVIDAIVSQRSYYKGHEDFIEMAVDEVLSLPTKKGGPGREKVKQESKS